MRAFCVVVHDVTPAFAGEVSQIVERLEPLVGRSLSAAVVPCWHGRKDAADARWFCAASKPFGELLLHGWTHERERRRGLISWLTNRADEFGGISASEAVDRLGAAQIQMAALLGDSLRGFVPPAWQFRGLVADLRCVGVEYLLGFQRLTSICGKSIPLATWSWDWGWLPGCTAGAWLGALTRFCCSAAVPVVVLHPLDVGRGCLPQAVRLITRLQQQGHVPILPSELLKVA